MPITGQTTPDDKDGIVYEVGVEADSVSEQVGQTTSGVAVPLIVDGLAAEKWKQEMLGYAVVNGAELHRVLPEPYGPDPLLFCMQLDRAQSYRGANIDEALDPEANDWPTYETLRYTATFAAPLYAVKEDDEVDEEHERFCVWAKRPTASNELVPAGAFRFPSDDVYLEQVPAKIGLAVELTCRWIDVPQVPTLTVLDCLNKVNDATVTLDGDVYPAETLLFKGAQVERRNNAYGLRTHDITYTFLARADDRTWNKVWRPKAGEMVLEEPVDSAGNKIYAQTGLLALWEVG